MAKRTSSTKKKKGDKGESISENNKREETVSEEIWHNERLDKHRNGCYYSCPEGTGGWGCNT